MNNEYRISNAALNNKYSNNVARMRGKSGVVLIFIMMAGVFGAIIAYSFFTASTASNRAEMLLYCDTQAMKTSDSGINYALYRLNNDFSLSIGSSYTFPTYSDGKGNYSVTLLRVDSELYKADSTSTYTVSGNTCSHQIEAYIQKRTKSIFTWGLFSNKDITFAGNPMVDSYNSDDGTYASQATNIDMAHGGVRYARANGDIGTNQNMIMSGNTLVYGDVSYGPAGAIFYGMGSYISGDTERLPEQIVLPSFDFPAAPATNNNDLIPASIYNPAQKKIKFTSGTQTLPTGTYYINNVELSSSANLVISDGSTLYLTDSMSLAGNSKITINGTVTIVVVQSTSISGNATINVNGSTTFYGGGDFKITGNGFVNTGQKPDKLQLYLSTNSQTTTNKVLFAGNADYYGTVYAPYAEVQISGNAATFGSVIGDKIKYNGNAKFHYDEDLANIQFGFQYWSVASWVKKK